jgi:hypothetical protein
MGVGMIRVESISNAGEHIEIAWADEADIDYQSGVIEYRTTRVPQEAIGNELISEFIDLGIQMLDAARVHKHRVADSFTGRR